MSQRLERVNVASLRVALISAGVAAAAYAVVSLVVVLYVTNNLTSQVDTRLMSSLHRIVTDPTAPIAIVPGGVRDPRGTPFSAPLLYWVKRGDGSVVSPNTTVALPIEPTLVGNPTTLTVNGEAIRAVGAGVGDGYVVLGESLSSVDQARSTVVAGESIVGLVLLIVVFFGALAIGRRVGAPIELARQRQMEFTADASHELRTPLSVIEAQTSLALNQERDVGWYRSAFQRVGGETRRMRHLVEDILWLARVDSMPGKPEAELVDLGVLAQQAVDRFMAVAESRGVGLTLTIAGDSHMVLGSAAWLDRLAGVLVDNACKYAPHGGHVAVTVSGGGGRVQIAVDDSGPGIDPRERSRIFDRFHRATDRAAGAGLGLAIADAVVRRTGGRWEVSTSPLGGASMVVSWPRAVAAS